MVYWWSTHSRRFGVLTMIILFLSMIVQMFTVSAVPFLAHSKAVLAGNAGDHTRAEELLHQALIASPHDPVLLYDAGVAECKLEHYESAVHYFEKAAALTEKPELQEEAWFNAGNAYAHQKRYDDALQQYEKVLAKNSNHDRAHHNYEQVKKLKEQEQQQDQQHRDDNNQNQDNKKDQNQKQQKQDNKNSDKSNNDKSNSEKSDQNQNNDNGDQSDDSDGSDQSNDHRDEQESDEERDGSSDSDQEQNNGQKNQKQQSAEPEKQQQQDGDTKQDKSSAEHDSTSQEKDRDYNNQREQSGNRHSQPSEKKESHRAQSNASAATEQAAESQGQPEMPAELEGPDKQWMRCALETCDKQDSKHNKQLLKAVVGNDKGDSRAIRSSW